MESEKDGGSECGNVKMVIGGDWWIGDVGLKG